MAEIVILGAGLTGLSTAYHLEKLNFLDYKIFEKDSTVGGLCRSVIQDGFIFDYTGHLLHINDDYFRNFIENIFPLTNFNVINRRSFVYSQEIYTKYPYQINLFGLPSKTISECIEGFLKRPKSKKNPDSFYQWVLQNFGEGLGKNFFFSYQEKIFSFNIKKLSASWTSRFVPSTSLSQMIEGAIKDKEDEKIGYNSQFFYPKTGGIQTWVEKINQNLINLVNTNYCVESIDIKNKIVRFSNGMQQKYNKLITTLPLDILLSLLIEPTSSNLSKASQKLLCNSVINFNLGISKPYLSEKHWIYYPEKKYPFYRIGFPHNFSELNAPAGCSSLYGELSYLQSSKKNINKNLKIALDNIYKIFNITPADILTEKIIDIKHAYVIYDKWRDQNINKILTSLEEMNIFSVGRYGAWKYSSMQEGVLDGKKIAETILQKIKIPMENHQIIPQEKVCRKQNLC